MNAQSRSGALSPRKRSLNMRDSSTDYQQHSFTPGSASTSNGSVNYKQNSLFMLGALALLGIGALLSDAFGSNSGGNDLSWKKTVSSLHLFPNTGDNDSKNNPYIYRYDSLIHQDESSNHVWTLVWSDAGWTPMKLVVEHMFQLPAYADLLARIDALQLQSNEQMQLYKYLGMASVGGGWLAEADVVPLRRLSNDDSSLLPNNGMLTCYTSTSTAESQQPETKHWTSMQSASGDEWLKAATGLLDHAQEFKHKHPNKVWTEQVGLEALFHQKQLKLFPEYLHEVTLVSPSENQDPTSNTAPAISLWTWNSVSDCAETKTKGAVHFKFDPASEWLNGSLDPAAAGEMMVKWLTMYVHSCEEVQPDVTEPDYSNAVPAKLSPEKAAQMTQHFDDPEEEGVEAPHPEAVEQIGVEPALAAESEVVDVPADAGDVPNVSPDADVVVVQDLGTQPDGTNVVVVESQPVAVPEAPVAQDPPPTPAQPEAVVETGESDQQSFSDINKEPTIILLPPAPQAPTEGEAVSVEDDRAPEAPQPPQAPVLEDSTVLVVPSEAANSGANFNLVKEDPSHVRRAAAPLQPQSRATAFLRSGTKVAGT